MTMTRCLRVLLVVAGMAALACDEKLSDLTGPTPNLEPSFSSIEQNIFQATDSSGRAACTQCHTSSGGRTPPQGISLDPGAAYGSLVGVASRQKPGLLRVNPGNPDESYLVHKLEGRADIVGQRMPRTAGPFLTEGQMMVIRRWIALGAPNN
jgi:hypothetical protein